MPGIRVKEHEAFETAIRRFKRTCEKAGLLTEMRRREYYEKPTWKRKRKAAAAKKRWLKRLSKETLAAAGRLGMKRKGKVRGRRGRA